MSIITTKRWYFYALRTLVASVIVGLFIWSSSFESNVPTFGQGPFSTVDEGWVQLVDGEEIPLDTAQDALCYDDNDCIILQQTIPSIEEDSSLLFYAIHQEVYVYIGDELVYSLICPEELSAYASPGRVWVEVAITPKDVGKEIRIEFSSSFSRYCTVPSELYFVPSADVESVQFNSVWLRYACAISLLISAIVCYIHSSIWKTKKLRRHLVTLADLHLFTGLWICSEVNLLAVIVGHSTTACILSMFFLRMIPVAFYHFVASTRPSGSVWMKVLGVLAWGNLILCLLLQFVFDISFVATLSLTVAIYGISCVTYLVGMVVRWHTQRFTHHYDMNYYATSVLLVGTLIEVYCYAKQSTLGHLNGVFASIACIIYAVLSHIILVKKNADDDVEKQTLEKRYHALQKKPLYQQISAHFLFNTLSGISGYCKQYPARADQAVGWLSQYMRRYMKLIDCGEYVPFTEEVALIEIYLNIQNLRYEEEINFVVDSRFDDFGLPPLTLQPLVENAVKHGLHGYITDGEIRVTTRRRGDRVEMTVSDNGCGCKSSEATQATGVGLRNLTRRIQAMGGNLRVESKPGAGTAVILSVPLKPNEYSEKESS